MSETVYVLSSPETLMYDYGGNTHYLQAGETRMTDQSIAQHILGKFQCRGVSLREEKREASLVAEV